MRVLKVTMSVTGPESRALALPFDVYGPNGERLGRGVVSPTEPSRVELSREANELPRVYVVAVRPDGDQLQASADLRGGPNDTIEVTLQAGTGSPHEWLQWVTPFRSLEHLRDSVVDSPASVQQRRVGQVWVTLWRLTGGQWAARDAEPETQLRSDGARLIVLHVPASPHLLQVGGDDVAWRLISLPPGGEVRVALTRRAAENGDTIDVTVGRVTPVNDLIMSYLSRGESARAASLADAWQAADLALFEKTRDPVSAAAGAYVLLKLNRLGDRRQWVNNLVNWFDYLPDGPIVAAAQELQGHEADLNRVRDLVMQAMARGLPVFSMGLTMLVETMAAIHRGKRESKSFQMHYQAARAYLHASPSKGAYLSFYGRSPAEPSATRLFGRPGTPRERAGEHRLGDGRQNARIPVLGSIAPSLERALAHSTRATVTDDLMRLGLSRQYSLPAEKGLQPLRDLGPRALEWQARSLIFPSGDLNTQRQSHALELFDGDDE